MRGCDRPGTRMGASLAEMISECRADPPHPSASGCHLLPQGEKGQVRVIAEINRPKSGSPAR